ncbi:hypothetical protein G6L12_08255 [Agrobacterium rhizogenes]|nr:hypothetical protein [Rhizobium rhizogenes]NTF74465.1 hypothetical protein [Rhizobium rhizogenes]
MRHILPGDEMNMAPRIQTFCCPSCGHAIGEASTVERILDADLTRQQRVIIQSLSNPVGQWVRVSALEKTIFTQNETGRDLNTHRQSIAVQISRAQRILHPLGWFIASDRRGCYRLIPITQSA